MKFVQLKKLVIFLFALTLCAYSQEQPKQQPAQEKVRTFIQIEVVSKVSDGSYILRIDGKLFRALDNKAMKNIADTQRERDFFMNQFRECQFVMRRRFETED